MWPEGTDHGWPSQQSLAVPTAVLICWQAPGTQGLQERLQDESRFAEANHNDSLGTLPVANVGMGLCCNAGQ